MDHVVKWQWVKALQVLGIRILLEEEERVAVRTLSQGLWLIGLQVGGREL